MLKNFSEVNSGFDLRFCQYGIAPDHVAVKTAVKKKLVWKNCVEMYDNADPKNGTIYAGKQSELGIIIPNTDKNQLIFVQIPKETKKASGWVNIGTFNM